jgi:hypothetical protein
MSIVNVIHPELVRKRILLHIPFWYAGNQGQICMFYLNIAMVQYPIDEVRQLMYLQATQDDTEWTVATSNDARRGTVTFKRCRATCNPASTSLLHSPKQTLRAR